MASLRIYPCLLGGLLIYIFNFIEFKLVVTFGPETTDTGKQLFSGLFREFYVEVVLIFAAVG